MKNLLIYYFQILLPLPLIYLSARNGMTEMFAILLFSYVIFRMFVDYIRLRNIGMIDKSEFKFYLFPFYNIIYFKELYFKY